MAADTSTPIAPSIPSDEREPKRQRHGYSKLAPAPARLAPTSDDADLYEGPPADEEFRDISSAELHSRQHFGSVTEDQQMLQQEQQSPGACGTEVRTSFDETCTMSLRFKASYGFIGVVFT